MKKLNLFITVLAVITTLLIMSSLAFGDDALYVAPSGRVGIGTSSSPGAKLDVAGKIWLDTDYYGVGFISSNTDTTYLTLQGGTSHYNGGYVQMYGKSIGNTYRQGDVWLVSNTAGSGGGNIRFYNFDGSSTWSERMRITDTGLVGIHTDSPTYTLSVYGTAGKTGGGSWSSFSDIRIKKDIKELTNAMELIAEYPKPITYKWKNPEEHENQTREIIGLSAQDLEEVNPEMVSEGELTGKDAELTDGEVKSIHFSNEFFALQLGAIQELIERVEALETENQIIKRELCKKDSLYLFCREN